MNTFQANISFICPEKIRTPLAFYVFQVDLKVEHWSEMG